MEESENHKKLCAISRKVNRAEKDMAIYISNMNMLSDQRLQERYNVLSQFDKVEDERHSQSLLRAQSEEKFTKEVDQSLIHATDIRSRTLYHKHHIDKILPQWTHTLNDAYQICQNTGHDHSTRWRSRVKAIFQKSLIEMADDQFAEEVKIKMRTMILNVNVHTANAFMRIINDLKSEYVKSTAKDNAFHSIGYHSRQLQELQDKSTAPIVPLPQGSWSSDLTSMEDRRRSHNITQTSVLCLGSTKLTAVSDSRNSCGNRNDKYIDNNNGNDDDDDDDGIDCHRNQSVSFEFSSPSPTSMSRSRSRTRSSSSHFTHSHARSGYPDTVGASSSDVGYTTDDLSPTTTNITRSATTTTTAVKNEISLRAAAVVGDFDVAWEIFTRCFDHNSQDAVATNPTTKTSAAAGGGSASGAGGIVVYSPLTKSKSNKSKIRKSSSLVIINKKPIKINIFKILMLAFKNSFEQNFEHAYLVMEAMERYGHQPDVCLYNILLQACVRENRWRRALSIVKDMQDSHNIRPNTHSYRILLDCCRHAMDEPGVIFDTLRLANLNKNFCYKAALMNASNRVSTQVVVEHTFDVTNSLSESVYTKYTPGKTYDEGTAVHTEKLKSGTNKLVAVRQALANTLSAASPAKNSHGLSTESFETHLRRLMPYAILSAEDDFKTNFRSCSYDNDSKVLFASSEKRTINIPVISTTEEEGGYGKGEEMDLDLDRGDDTSTSHMDATATATAVELSSISERLDNYTLEADDGDSTDSEMILQQYKSHLMQSLQKKAHAPTPHHNKQETTAHYPNYPHRFGDGNGNGNGNSTHFIESHSSHGHPDHRHSSEPIGTVPKKTHPHPHVHTSSSSPTFLNDDLTMAVAVSGMDTKSNTMRGHSDSHSHGNISLSLSMTGEADEESPHFLVGVMSPTSSSSMRRKSTTSKLAPMGIDIVVGSDVLSKNDIRIRSPSQMQISPAKRSNMPKQKVLRHRHHMLPPVST